VTRLSGRPEACEMPAGGVPDCSTGPFGRLAWSLGELAGLLRLPGRARRAP